MLGANCPKFFKEKGCEEMIYEYWYTIGDKNGIDLIYYSQISSIKNEFSTSYSSVPELKKAMESRFSKLLKMCIRDSKYIARNTILHVQ